MNLRSRKGQIEIMGLMIIVVMISLIILFAISAVFLKKPTDRAGDFSRKTLASSMIGGILKTSSGCTQDTRLEDLFIAAAKTQITCDQAPPPQCPGISTSNEYLECGVREILTQTLVEFKLYHQFVAFHGDSVIVHINSDDLPEEDRPIKRGNTDAYQYKLPVYPTDEIIDIWLCIGNTCPPSIQKKIIT